ncbi:MAG: ATPase, T2SS/T4P/T4SS family [Candidatus Micrarchaeota archaeon]
MKILQEYSLESDGVPADVVIAEKDEEYIKTYDLRHAKTRQATNVVLNYLKERIIEATNIKISEVINSREAESVRSRLIEKAHELVRKELGGLSQVEENMLVGRLAHEMLGLGDLELLLADENLEEIVVNSANEPIFVYHKKLGWLKTNLRLQSEEQIQNYASIIGRRVGKQITVLNPLMDAHLLSGNRVNATLSPISSKGNGITIRKFRADPWTIVNFIDPALNTLNSETAALLWQAVQYEMNILVAGGTASGKTSFLNSLLVFTPPNQRVVSIEDSVAGESKMLFEKNGVLQYGTIASLADSALEKEKTVLADGTEVSTANDDVKVFAMNRAGKIVLAEPSAFIRHRVNKKMFEVTLATGKRIRVTGDHSLFGLRGNKIIPVKARELAPGSLVATPRALKAEGGRKNFDLLDDRNVFDGFMVKGGARFGEFIASKKTVLKRRCSKPALRHYLRERVLPSKLFYEALEGERKNEGKAILDRLDAVEEFRSELAIVAKRGSRFRPRVLLPTLVEFDAQLAEFAGLWLADGSFDKTSVILSVVDEQSRRVVKSVAERFDCNVKFHSDGISLMLNSKAFKAFFQKLLGFDGNAYTKRVPKWVFSCDSQAVAGLLRGYFSGDGWVRKNEVAVRSSSLGMLEDMQTLLLRFGVPLRISRRERKDKTFEARVSGAKFLAEFRDSIGFLPSYKQEKLFRATLRTPHDVSDVVPLDKKSYLELKHAAGDAFKKTLTYKSWKSWHGSYVTTGKNIGREQLKKMVLMAASNGTQSHGALTSELRELSLNDLAWERVTAVSEKNFEGFVYDLSVPGCESFVCENIVAHNTRELVLPDFLHWTPLVTREANPEGKGEVSMLDLIVNSLRMRPDRIVLGEVRRQREAEVLFEAMHTGHAVYATLHADEARQVRSRLISPPIELPETMLGALHLIVVQYRQRRTGIRRTFEIAEVVPEEKGVSLNITYKWDPRDDAMRKVSESVRVVNDLVMHTGLSGKEIQADLSDKKRVLEYMVTKKVFQVNDVGRIVGWYYRDPERLDKFVSKKLDPTPLIKHETEAGGLGAPSAPETKT